MLNAATGVNASRVPPGNRLEALKGDRAGTFSIRVNDQNTAIRLEALTLMDAGFWLRLQTDWDLWRAQHSRRRGLKVKPLAVSA